MTFPRKPLEEFMPDDQPIIWGVEKNTEPIRRSLTSRIIWIILTILIILSLVLPWIAPYFVPRRPVIDPDILALLQSLLQVSG